MEIADEYINLPALCSTKSCLARPRLLSQSPGAKLPKKFQTYKKTGTNERNIVGWCGQNCSIPAQEGKVGGGGGGVKKRYVVIDFFGSSSAIQYRLVLSKLQPTCRSKKNIGVFFQKFYTTLDFFGHPAKNFRFVL